MMLTPLIRRQLVVFGILSVVVIVFSALRYGDAGRSVGLRGYTVTADFADVSGLYPRANVTYRGVTVGRVGGITLTDDGARVTLGLEHDRAIPADVTASLQSTSAIGEQYVDLVPAGTGSTGTLRDGANIPRERTTPMPQIGPVLDKLNGLLRSLPKRETRSLLRQVDRGIGGAGADLGVLVDESSRLVTEAQSRILETTQLIEALDPVLATQQRLSPETRSYLEALALVSDQLAASDQDLTRLLDTGPTSLDSLRATVDELSPLLPGLVEGASAATRPLHVYRDNLEHTLVTYPALVAVLQPAVNTRADHGEALLDLATTVGNPRSCNEGYLDVSQRRSPGDLTTRPTRVDHYCQLDAVGPEGVRGQRNHPCPDSTRRGPTPASCGIDFSGVTGAGPPPRSSTGSPGTGPATGTRTEPTIRPTNGAQPWLSLLMASLGRRG